MSPAIRGLLLKRIVKDWETLKPTMRPSRMWIREYPTAPKGRDGFALLIWPSAVWTVDESGVKAKTIFNWRQWEIIQTFCDVPNPIWGEPHEIGMSAFSPTEEENVFYVENTYGKRFGYGMLLKWDGSGGLRDMEMVWRS